MHDVRRHPVLSYGIAILCLALAVAAMRIPALAQAPGTAILAAYFAVLMAAWYGGLGPGVLVVTLAVLLALPASFRPGPIVRLVLFATGGVLISLLVEALHAARRRAEQSALRHQALEERYRLLFEAIPQPIWVHDAATLRFLAVNEAAIQLYGYTREEFLAKTITDLRPREDLPALPESDARHREMSSGDAAGWRHRKKDGTIIDLEIRTYALDFEGRPARVVLANDVTERRRAERALRLLAETSSVLASSLDPQATLAGIARSVVPALADYCVIDAVEPDGTIRRLAANHADPACEGLTRELLRYPPDPGRPDGAPEVLRTGRSLLRPEITEMHLANTARDAEHLMVLRALGPRSALLVPLRARGRLFGVLNLVMTNSNRRYALEDLETAEELAYRAALALDNARLYREAQDALHAKDEAMALLDTLYEMAPVGLAFHDRDLRFSRVNRALAAINGMTPDVHLGRTPSQVIPRLEGQVTPFLRRVLETGSSILDVEIGGPSPTEAGAAAHWLASFYPVRPSGSAAIGVGVVVADVTERRRLEAELRAAKEAADVASRAKDRFLAVLSHELRTPLTPVLLAATSMLEDAQTTPEVRETLEMIQRNVMLEARLIDDLLDVTRIGRGRLQLEFQQVDAHEAIRQAVATCWGEITTAGLHLEISLEAPTAHVEADPARLQQILWNLIKNAAKFTPPGGSITLRTRNAGEDPQRGAGRLIVEVTDTGIGIEPEALPRIFDAFELGHPRGRPRSSGLGLGLTIGRSLAEAHSGTLTADSPGAGRGSTFRLELPAFTQPWSAAGLPAAPSSPSGRPHEALRILLVEDNQDTLRYIALVLKARGHEVRVAGRVADALEQVDSWDFDLLVSDVELPDGTGLDLMRRLGSRGLPGVAMSGYGTDEDVRQSLAAGFAEHLIKPIDVHRLEEALLRVTRVSRQD